MQDICERKHGGNAQSVAANVRAEKATWRVRILEFAKIRLVENFTSKEVCAYFGKGLNELSGRFTELKQDGLIVETGETREGCAVYEVVE